MREHISIVHCPMPGCGSAVLHTCQDHGCRHDIGLELMRHVQYQHPLIVYEVGEFERIVERMRLTQFAHDSRN